MALELFLEQRFAERDGLVLSRLVEPRCVPHRVGRLDDERRMPLLVLVGVHPPQAVLVALEVEREGREGTGRTEPDEAVGPLVKRRLKLRGESSPNRTVEAVGTHHEIRVGIHRRIGDFGADFDAHPQLLTPLAYTPRSARRDSPLNPWPLDVITR